MSIRACHPWGWDLKVGKYEVLLIVDKENICTWLCSFVP
jgi:hypothetical protein